MVLVSEVSGSTDRSVMSGKVVRLLVADDSDAMRTAIRQMLTTQSGIQLLGEATTFAETLKMTAT